MFSLPPLLEQAFIEKAVYSEFGEKLELGSNVSAEEARQLAGAVRSIRPAVSVEIGLAQGISTLAILNALQDTSHGIHHVIDPYQSQYQNSGLAMVQRAGLESRFVFYSKFPEEVIPLLPPLQFAFVDASHLFDLTMAEFVLIDKKLEINGVIGFHDLWMPSLQKLIRYVLANRAYRLWGSVVRPPIPATLSLKRSIKQLIRSMLLRLPGRERIFREELLHPWANMEIANLVFLQKTAHDQRDWRFHRSF